MRNWNRLAGMAFSACAAAFGGQSVQYHPLVSDPEAGGPFALRTAVFDPDHVEMTAGEVAAPAVQPRLEVSRAELTADPLEGDRVYVDDVLYTVRSAQTDGAGQFVLLLHKGTKARW